METAVCVKYHHIFCVIKIGYADGRNIPFMGYPLIGGDI